MICSFSHLKHYIKGGQCTKCVISLYETAGQPESALLCL